MTRPHPTLELAATQTRVLEEIATGRPLTVILDTLVCGIQAQSDGVLASVLLLDETGTRLLHGSAPGLPDAYNQAIDGMAIGPSAGPCGTAAHTGLSVIVEDIAGDPLWADFGDLAAAHGLVACWATPILSSTRAVLGTFALYHRQRRAPDQRHLRLVEVASHLAAVAIAADRDREALRRSEERYRSLVAEAPVGIFLADATGKGTFANEELARILGHPSADLLGDGWAVHVHHDDQRRVIAGWRAAAAAREPWSAEFRVHRADGTMRWVAASTRPQLDEGRLTGFVGTYADITGRREAEVLARAEAERQRLEEVFRQAPSAIVAFGGPDHIIQFVNDAYLQLLPGRADVVGRPARDAWLELGGEAFLDLLDHVYQTGVPFRADEAKARLNGHDRGEVQELYLDVLCAPRRGPEGRVDGVIAHVVDVTDLVRARQDLERSLEAQRFVAHTLQQSLLPSRLPEVPGLELAGRYRPGAAGTEVGGDWYDVFRVHGGRLGFAVGDVVGRGVAAAATMGQLRAAVRAYALDLSSPGAILQRMTRLAEDLDEGAMVATLLVGVLDLEHGQLRLAAAGHPPALVISADGRSRYVEEGRTAPLGVVLEPSTDAVVQLEEGMTVLCYTDGLIERRDESINDGLEALRRCVADPWRDLDMLLDEAVLPAFAADGADDDVALLALRIVPVAP
ncbi:MAG TPA: SpoIIE family protein phosphatase [Acidimicrobiales bacterium]|nr:SpoIIE family protein phosphatase [Acidimicrobiales bacterium]